MDPISYFSKDTAIYTFSFLDFSSLARCTKVSKKWREYATQDSLWQSFINSTFPEFLLTKPNEISVHNFFTTRAYTTLDQLIDHIHSIFQKVLNNHKYSFECYFPAHLSQCILYLEFGFYKEYDIVKIGSWFHKIQRKSRKPVDFVESCFFMGTLAKDQEYYASEQMEARLYDLTCNELESRFLIQCKLTSDKLSKKCVESIKICYSDIRVEGDYIRINVPQKQIVKKEKTFCIIA